MPWVSLVWNRYYIGKVPHECREIGSFWWRDVMRLNVIYRNIARCSIGDGSTVSFWNDLWSSSVLSVEFPRLHFYAKNDSISVQSLMSEQELDNILFLPLSTQAYDELLLLESYLEDIEFDENTSDSWSSLWGSKYTSRWFYTRFQ
jgi:hypothetical protein